MNPRITTDRWLVPERSYYRTSGSKHQIDLHVFTTITHDFVGLDFVREIGDRRTTDTPSYYLVLSNEDAERLVATLTAAIESNNENERKFIERNE